MFRITSVPIVICLGLASLHVREVAGLSLFMRTTWLAELPEPVWRGWFELIAKGRKEGPSSPYYVEELALQNTACCESHAGGTYKALGCLGPKCSDLGLPPNSLLTKELDAMSEYFPLFDRVYVGTTTSQDWNGANRSSTEVYAALQASIGKEFMNRYGKLPNVKYAWYLTTEGSVPEIGLSTTEAQIWGEFLSLSMNALHGVSPMEFLWSPSNGDITPTPAQRVTEEAGLKDMLCGLSHPLAIHFQDWLGQSVSFEFPFYYNYSVAFTCEKDTVPTVAMLHRIQATCPDNLREVKVNAELFAERLNHGQHGEDDGANIINADPREVATRLACYKHHNLPVGCSWAMPHWYSLMTYANATVYSPY
eukprot:m.260986 g.260986  ORF g.260986 m.260986 type:complete len:365 (+) comp41024_c0_seq1:119-1213(+)